MKHNLIKTENYLLVVDDSEIKEGDWAIHNYKDYRERFEEEPIKANKNNVLSIQEHWDKIIAHLPLNNAPYLDGVDVLPPNWRAGGEEDEVEELANEEYELQQKSFEDSTEMFPFNDSMLLKSGFISGYNKAREKYKFTEEDLVKAIAFGFGVCRKENRAPFDLEQIKFIQSLQQPKLPVAFECEIEISVFGAENTLYDATIEDYVKLKTTINSEGRIEWVGKYIYE